MNKKLITGGTIGLTFLLNANIAMAGCDAAAECEKLGYTETSCEEGSNSLKCFFDSSKMYCGHVEKLNGVIGDNCYENNVITGVKTNVTNLCLSTKQFGPENWSFAMGYDAEDVGDNCTVSTTSSYYPCGECYGNHDCTVETSSSPCSSLGSGWRLPTLSEWQSIVEETNTNPEPDYTALNTLLSAVKGAKQLSNPNYWSSTEYPSSTTLAYTFIPYSATTYYYTKYNYYCVRCVREF